MLPDSRLYYRAMVVQAVWCWMRASMGQSGKQGWMVFGKLDRYITLHTKNELKVDWGLGCGTRDNGAPRRKQGQ